MSLPITGERTVPGSAAENYWFRRHEVVYRYAGRLAHDARVLEAGCGEGYGAASLAAAGASCVVALDLDATAVAHAGFAYPEVPVLRGNLVALPLRAASFDVVVSLQTIEHLWDQPAFVREALRVLRPGGRLVLSTPNRLTFPPGNPFHSRELDARELLELLSVDFPEVSLLGVHHGRRISSYDLSHGSVVDAQLAAPPDRWAPGLAAFVAGLRAADFELRKPNLDRSLDLVAVAIRP